MHCVRGAQCERELLPESLAALWTLLLVQTAEFVWASVASPDWRSHGAASGGMGGGMHCVRGAQCERETTYLLGAALFVQSAEPVFAAEGRKRVPADIRRDGGIAPA